EHALNSCFGSWFQLAKKRESSRSTLQRSVSPDIVSMRAHAVCSEPLNQLLLEIGRDRMLQAFRFVMDLIPLHPKHFGKHAFDQVMAESNPLRYRSALRC